jgi:hypothetical protein
MQINLRNENQPNAHFFTTLLRFIHYFSSNLFRRAAIFREDTSRCYTKHVHILILQVFYITMWCILPEDGSSPRHVGGKIVNKTYQNSTKLCIWLVLISETANFSLAHQPSKLTWNIWLSLFLHSFQEFSHFLTWQDEQIAARRESNVRICN